MGPSTSGFGSPAALVAAPAVTPVTASSSKTAAVATSRGRMTAPGDGDGGRQAASTPRWVVPARELSQYGRPGRAAGDRRAPTPRVNRQSEPVRALDLPGAGLPLDPSNAGPLVV